MKMTSDDKRICSVANDLEIYCAGQDEYRSLSSFHYRETSLAPYAAIYAVRSKGAFGQESGQAIAVIVYTMPVPNLKLRNIATGGRFNDLGSKSASLQMINSNIRCISRVIIEPRYRGLGIAAWLVRRTMPLIDVPIVESLAVMGRFSSFFEKAGMKATNAPIPERCVRLIEALSIVGIDEDIFIAPSKVHQTIDSLDANAKKFIDWQIANFLQAYGKRRFMPSGIERIRYVLSKLTDRPVYYIWFNVNFRTF